MKLARPALAIALGASLVIAGTADAKAKPKPKPLPCNMVTDPANDADIQGGVGNDDSLDITSFDVASDDKKVTMVWRVKKASLKSSVFPVGGIQWDANFDLGEFHLTYSVASDGTTPTGIFSEQATGNANVLGFYPASVDTAKNEVHMTVPVSDFPARIKPGMVFSNFALDTANGKVVLSTGVVDGSGGGLYGDSVAAPDSAYKAGAKNCVVVGK